jgi:hypothetical protein
MQTQRQASIRASFLWGAVVLVLGMALLVQWRNTRRLKQELAAAQTVSAETRLFAATEEPPPLVTNSPERLIEQQLQAAGLLRARSELAQLQQRLRLLESLTADNERLKQELTAAKQNLAENAPSVATDKTATPRSPVFVRPGVTLTDEPGLTVEEKIEALRCANQLQQISLATDLWAANRGGVAPSDLTELKEYLAPMILVCPSARPKSVSWHWHDFDPHAITYGIRAPGILWKGPHTTYVFCPIHQLNTLNWPMETGVNTRYLR